MSEDLTNTRRSIRRSAVLSLAGVLIFTATLLYSSYHLATESNQIEQLNKETDMLKTNIAMLRDTSGKLTTYRDSLSKSILNLVNLQKELNNGKGVGLNDQNLNKAINSLILVGLSGLNVDSVAFNQVKTYLQQEGYSITRSVIYAKHEKWLPDQPMVFYYDQTMALQAETLAKNLTNLTHKKFTAQTGAGLGVVKGEESATLKVDFCLEK